MCVAGHIQTLYPARGNINRINKSFSRVLFALFFVCSPFFLPPGLPFQLCHKYSPPCPRWPQDPEKVLNQILFYFFKYSIAIYARILKKKSSDKFVFNCWFILIGWSRQILYDEYSDWKRFHHRSGWFPRVHIRSLDLLAAIIEFSVI